jgi:hypothetical protein
MKTMIAAAVLTMVAADVASAAGGCQGPACQQPGAAAPQGGFFSRLLGKQPMPAFQAAPWYLYYPYNAHFQTPAPIGGAFYAPPTANPYGANPFFPGR